MKKRFRWYAYALCVLLLLGISAVLTNRLVVEPVVKGALIGYLNDAYDIQATIGTFKLNPLFGSLELNSLRLVYQGRVILTAKHVRVSFQRLLLILLKNIHIHRVHIHGLQVYADQRLQTLADHLQTVRAPDEKPAYTITISGVIIKQAGIRVHQQDISLRIHNLNARAFAMPKKIYTIWLSCTTTGHQPLPPFAYQWDLKLAYDSRHGQLSINKPADWNVRTEGIGAKIAGSIDFLKKDCDIAITNFPLPLSLAHEQLAGAVCVDGFIRHDLHNPDFQLELADHKAGFGDIDLSLGGRIAKYGNKIHLKALRVASGQGSALVSGSYTLSEVTRPGQFNFSLDRVDYNRIMAHWFQHPTFHRQFIDCTGRLTVHRDANNRLRPTASATINLRGEAPCINGRIQAAYKDKIVYITDSEFAIRNSKLLANGQIHLARDRYDLDYQYFVANAHRQFQFVRNLVSRDILDEREDIQSFLEFWDSHVVSGGWGTINGRMEGPLANPVIRGEVNGHDIVFKDVPMDRIQARVVYTDENIYLKQASIITADGSITGSGRINLKEEAHDTLDLNLLAQDYSCHKVLQFFDLPYQYDGRVSGPVRVKTVDADTTVLFDRVTVTEIQGPYVSNATLTARGGYRGSTLNISELVLAGKQGNIQGSGGYDFSRQSVDLRLAFNDFLPDINAIEPALPADQLYLSGAVVMAGAIDSPSLDVDASIHGISRKGMTLPDIHCKGALTKGNGDIGINWADDLTLTLGVQNFSRFSLSGPFDFANLMPIIHFFSGQELGETVISATGKIEGSFALARPENTQILFLFDTMNMQFLKRNYTNPEPIKVLLYHGQLMFKDFALSQDRHSLQVGGIIDPIIGFDLNIQSGLDISLLAPLIPLEEIATLKGASHIYLDVLGDLSEPTLRGHAVMDDVFLRLKSLRSPISNIAGTVSLEGGSINLQKLTGRFNTGELSANGSLLLGKQGLEDVYITLDATNIAYALPKIFTTRLDFNLSMSGAQKQGFLLSGQSTVHEFTYLKRMDIKTRMHNLLKGFIIGGNAVSLDKKEQPERPLKLDIAVIGNRNLSVQNDLGDIYFSTDLRLSGTLDNPIPIGRVDIKRGTLLLLDTQFDRIKGYLEFANPIRIDPYLSFTGTTTISGYNIALNLEGSLSNPVLRFSSKPTLSEMDILSLLGVGRTTKQILAANAQTSVGGYFIDTMLAGRTADYIEKKAEDIFQLDRFVITPILSGTENNLSAKITMEKRIGNRLFLLYTVVLSNTEEQVAMLKYKLTPSLYVVVMRSEFGSVGGDLGVNFLFE